MSRSAWLGGLCWCAYLLAMTASGDLSALLVPWQHHIVVGCGGVLAGLLVLAARSLSGSWRDLAWTVHLLPLLLWLRVGSPELGGHGVEERLALGSGSPAEAEPAPPTPPPILRYYPGTEPAEEAPLTLTIPAELDLGRIYAKAQDGQVVITLGKIRRPSAGLQVTMPLKHWGLSDPLLLFRYRIICCAADAVPMTALVTGLELGDLPDDTWVEVTATVTWQSWDRNRIPVLAASAWRQIPAPTWPFLYRWQ